MFFVLLGLALLKGSFRIALNDFLEGLLKQIIEQ